MINKGLIYGFLGFLCVLLSVTYGQNSSEYDEKWQDLKDKIEYRKSINPKGPSGDYISYPGDLNESGYTETYSENPSEENVIVSREQRYNDGSETGVHKQVKDGDKKDFQDLDKPETDAPRFNPKFNQFDKWGKGAELMLKLFLILLLLGLVSYLIYFFVFKNISIPDSQLKEDVDEDDLDPRQLEKSKLEEELKIAIQEGDYRMAIRIYYILLLKDLIEKNWIQWAKRKTNSHYLMEMASQNEAMNFNRAVLIYEWAWYGKNTLPKDDFERVSAFYNQFLKRLYNE